MSLKADKTKNSRAKRWAFQGLVLITALVDLMVVIIALWSKSFLSHLLERLPSGNSTADGKTLEKIGEFILPMLELLIVVPTLNLFVIIVFCAKQRKPNVSSSSLLT